MISTAILLPVGLGGGLDLPPYIGDEVPFFEEPPGVGVLMLNL